MAVLVLDDKLDYFGFEEELEDLTFNPTPALSTSADDCSYLLIVFAGFEIISAEANEFKQLEIVE